MTLIPGTHLGFKFNHRDFSLPVSGKAWLRSLLLLSVLFGLIAWEAPNADAATRPNFNHRFIIFVHGIRVNDSVRHVRYDLGRETFGEIRDALVNPKGGYGLPVLNEENFLYFSYDDSDNERWEKTLEPVSFQSERMSKLIKATISRYPDATFDIIAHSLGGVVATYWAALSPFEQRERLHSVITIDSPVRGASAEYEKYCLTAWKLVSFGPEVCRDLDKTGNTITKVVPKAVDNANVFYIRNEQDTLVKSEVAYLDGAIEIARLNQSGYPNRYSKKDRDAHGAGLSVPQALLAIQNVIANNYYRPGLAALPITLEQSKTWSFWEGWWLFGKRTYATSTPGRAATIEVPANHRYVLIRTQKHTGRGTLLIKIDGREDRITNLQQAEYKDLELQYDLGAAAVPRTLRVELIGGGSLNVNSVITAPLSYHIPSVQNGMLREQRKLTGK